MTTRGNSKFPRGHLPRLTPSYTNTITEREHP